MKNETLDSTKQHHCRHQIPAIGGDLPEKQDTLVFVGWDRALNTFFLQAGRSGQVYGEPNEIDGEDINMHWVGTSWGEIPTAEDLVKRVWNGTEGDEKIGLPWAELPEEMINHLKEYQLAMPAGRTPRGFLDGGLSL